LIAGVMPGTPGHMRKLLSTVHFGLELRAYFVDEMHHPGRWDGKSEMPAKLDRVIANANRYANRVAGREMSLRSLQLSASPLRGHEEYWYFTVDFAPGVEDDHSGFTVVLVDLGGEVIEPEISKFANDDDLCRYMESLRERSVKG
jgi:hypothetical protein